MDSMENLEKAKHTTTGFDLAQGTYQVA